MNMKLQTLKNLESAFAGESMAYQKYLYFAKLARKKGYDDVAKIFEETAKHEIGHAEGHLRFLYPEEKLSVEDLLKIAIKGEEYEYSEMYPTFEKIAKEEGELTAVNEFQDQIDESREHALNFSRNLEKISKVFAGLTKAEKIHADGYKKTLESLKK